MRAWRIGVLVVVGGALPGCGALLDLDVHFVDAGGETAADGQVPDSIGIDGTTPDVAPLDGAAPDVVVDPSADANPGLDGNSTVDGDASLPDVAPGDAAPDVSIPDAGIPTFVQGTADSVMRTTRTFSLSFGKDIKAHDTIVVAVDYGTASGLTVSDSLGNPLVAALQPVNDGSGTSSAIWYATDVNAGTDTVTVTTTASTSFFELYIHEYSGIAGLDGAKGQTGIGLLMESGFVTTTARNDLIFGFGVTGAGNPGTGFTLRSSVDSNVTEDRIAALPGMYEATGSASGTNPGWTMTMAAFLAR